MTTYELRDKLTPLMGEEVSRELLSFIEERSGKSQSDRRAAEKAEERTESIDKRLDRIEKRMDDLFTLYVRLIQWMVGIGIGAVGLTVTLVKLLE